MTNTRPIVIKKVSNHGGHHGGAWKVAYADFVTAMMALFIVLWLLSSSKKVQESVSNYFNDPSGKAQAASKAPVPGRGGAGENLTITKENMDNLKEELQAAISKMTAFEKLKSQIGMTVTNEGLRVDLMETEKGTFFPSGSPELTENGKEILILLAKEVGQLPNRVTIEGHTDARPFASGANYGNWELSADRANAARRIMLANGLRPHQASEVRGYADERLKLPDRPEDPSNRRISLLVQYVEKAEAAPAPGPQPSGGAQPAQTAPPAAKH
jgi:chemotaxis protein MotB